MGDKRLMQMIRCDICCSEIEPNKEYVLTLRPKFKVAHDDTVKVEIDVCPCCAKGFTEAVIREATVLGNRCRARRMAPREGE